MPNQPMCQLNGVSSYPEFPWFNSSASLDVFDQALTEILSHENPQAYSILSAIQRMLRQYRLASQIEPFEILHEAYLRGKQKLQTGETITNAHAWLRSTAFYIISERKRKDRDGATEPHILEAIVLDERINLMQQQILAEELKLLYQALAKLQQEDPTSARLLTLKTFRDWSWGDIRDWLISQGEPAVSETTLRQRASRAKRRLREIFLQSLTPETTALGTKGKG
ncbi:MAG: sigma-70 family RNA polymerase sigma factor [Leptolyngbyaceae cyanobacterium SM2_5_2]|nr:sigma-70 family RNA polymerase sigma factor [Leptolyngbyaceae cyanobacterium SM2_5_2]